MLDLVKEFTDLGFLEESEEDGAITFVMDFPDNVYIIVTDENGREVTDEEGKVLTQDAGPGQTEPGTGLLRRQWSLLVGQRI